MNVNSDAPPDTVITSENALSFFNRMYCHQGDMLEVEYLHHDGTEVESHTATGILKDCAVYRNITLIENGLPHHHPFFGVDSAITAIRKADGTPIYERVIKIDGPLDEAAWRKKMNKEMENAYGKIGERYLLRAN